MSKRLLKKTRTHLSSFFLPNDNIYVRAAREKNHIYPSSLQRAEDGIREKGREEQKEEKIKRVAGNHMRFAVKRVKIKLESQATGNVYRGHILIGVTENHILIAIRLPQE